MKNKLLLKLMGAFLLVVVIGASVMSFLTSRATQNAFNLYTTRSGQVWAQRLVPILEDYYGKTNSWQGVGSIIQSSLISQENSGTIGGIGQGRGFGQGQQMAGGEMMGILNQRLILIDENGYVVYDSLSTLETKQLSESDMKYGSPIAIENKLVGTLIITPSDSTILGSPAAEFRQSVQNAIVGSALIVTVFASILGAILFIQIISPLRQLEKAATAISNGDLTQRVKIQSHDEFGELGKTFNIMAENLSNAELQRQHLMSDVAHELRTPVAAIQGTLEGIQDGILPLDDEQLAVLHTETLLLNRLIGDLRLLSLAEAGQLKLELQKVEPGKLIGQALERFTSQAIQKKICLESDIEPGLPNFRLDPDRIAQVLNNLIGNALHYTPSDGIVKIKALLIPEFKSLQISVTDTGEGIDPDGLPHVFDRFFRTDRSRSRSSGGSGLGLAIVKQLVEAHKGVVSAESPVFNVNGEKGFGTRISFTIPGSL